MNKTDIIKKIKALNLFNKKINQVMQVVLGEINKGGNINYKTGKIYKKDSVKLNNLINKLLKKNAFFDKNEITACLTINKWLVYIDFKMACHSAYFYLFEQEIILFDGNIFSSEIQKKEFKQLKTDYNYNELMFIDDKMKQINKKIKKLEDNQEKIKKDYYIFYNDYNELI